MKKFLEAILNFYARLIIKKYHPEVIAVTGSVGKTSTKNAIATVLAGKFHLRASQGSYNNELGVPLTIIGAAAQGKNLLGWLGVFWKAKKLFWFRDKNYPDVLVLEFAADHLGDIEYLSKLAKPRVGVLTAISIAHTLFFKDLETIKTEKSKLIKLLPPDGIAVLNADDPNVFELSRTVRVKTITFGTTLADVRAERIAYSLAGTSFNLKLGNESKEIILPSVLGIGHVNAVTAAAAVGHHFGMNVEEIKLALQKYKGEPGRAQIKAGIKNTYLLDDTYNASPRAVHAALQVLKTLEAPGRKIIALGDMLELGDLSESAHREIAHEMLFADYIVLVGKNVHWTDQELKKSGFNDTNLIYLDDAAEAGRHLQVYIKEGDCVLVKGSHGIKMEKIIDELSAIGGSASG